MSLTTQPEHATSAQYDPLIPAEFRTGADGKNNPYYVDFSDEIDAIYDLADELAGESVSRSVGTMQGAFAAMANAAGADPQVDANAPVEESIRAMSGKLGGTQMAKVWASFTWGDTGTPAMDKVAVTYVDDVKADPAEAAHQVELVEDTQFEGYPGYYLVPVGAILFFNPASSSYLVNVTSFDGLAMGGTVGGYAVPAGADTFMNDDIPAPTRAVDGTASQNLG